VTAPSIVLVRDTQVSFFVYGDYRGDADIAWAKRTGRWLIDATLRANAEVDNPRAKGRDPRP